MLDSLLSALIYVILSVLNIFYYNNGAMLQPTTWPAQPPTKLAATLGPLIGDEIFDVYLKVKLLSCWNILNWPREVNARAFMILVLCFLNIFGRIRTSNWRKIFDGSRQRRGFFRVISKVADSEGRFFREIITYNLWWRQSTELKQPGVRLLLSVTYIRKILHKSNNAKWVHFSFIIFSKWHENCSN